MPLKPLPKPLVKRLVKASRVIDRNLGSMKNIDPRQHDSRLAGVSPLSTFEFGRRVRQMNVSKNFPRVGTVIKRVHGGLSDSLFFFFKGEVEAHQRLKPKRYLIRAPKIYVLGDHLIAMSKTAAPTVSDLFEGGSKAKSFFGRYTAQKPTLAKLRLAYNEFERNSERNDNIAISKATFQYETNPDHVYVAGFVRGKFVFVPKPDFF